MSVRGAAPATLADALALLEPGDDVFFWIDRADDVIAARTPVAELVLDEPNDHALWLGCSPFDGIVSGDEFQAYHTVARTSVPEAAADDAPVRLVAHGDPAALSDRVAWRELVGRALDVIESGAASKIVCARTARLRLDSDVDARALAAALLRTRGTYRYLLREGDVVFAGATPERLIEKRGDVVRTEAVAGTAPVEHDDTPLDAREKDRREHHAVVLAIDEALAPHTRALEHVDAPVIRKHGTLAHLVTLFEGRVDASTHVLDLADALHPTPAVAGTPRDVALDFINRHERARGLYAGPVGWFDRNGDGELAVALRCVRIEGNALDLYAGAGIVAGSDPDAEFDETVLKMTSTLRSLGFELRA